MPNQVTYQGVTYQFPDDATEQEIADTLRGASAPPVEDDAPAAAEAPSALGLPPPGIMGAAGQALRMGGPAIVKGGVKTAAKTLKLAAAAPKLIGGGIGASLGAVATAPLGAPFLGAHVGGIGGSKAGKKLAGPMKAAAKFIEELGQRTAISKTLRGKSLGMGRRILGKVGTRVIPGVGTAMLAADALNAGMFVGGKIDNMLNTPEAKTARDRAALEAEMLRLQSDPIWLKNQERARTGKL